MKNMRAHSGSSWMSEGKCSNAARHEREHNNAKERTKVRQGLHVVSNRSVQRLERGQVLAATS